MLLGLAIAERIVFEALAMIILNMIHLEGSVLLGAISMTY